MNKTTISVGSITYAQKAKRLLRLVDIHTKLVKLDTAKTLGGCTHGLELDERDYYLAVMELKKAGIHYMIYN